MGVLNLGDQLAFYRAYHVHPVNVAIHLVFIPTILFSSVTFLSYLNYSQYVPPLSSDWLRPQYEKFLQKYVFNVGSTMLILFSAFYVTLDFVSGSIYATIILTVAYYLEHLYDYYPAKEVVQYSVALHISAWIAQFIGHGFFEHRAPALLDNLLQAMVLAPFFVFYELQFALGFNKDLKTKMDNRAAHLISEFRRQKTASAASKKKDI